MLAKKPYIMSKSVYAIVNVLYRRWQQIYLTSTTSAVPRMAYHDNNVCEEASATYVHDICMRIPAIMDVNQPYKTVRGRTRASFFEMTLHKTQILRWIQWLTYYARGISSHPSCQGRCDNLSRMQWSRLVTSEDWAGLFTFLTINFHGGYCPARKIVSYDIIIWTRRAFLRFET